MTLQRWCLPPSWEWTRAEDVANIVGGGTPSTADAGNFAAHGIPWIGPADLTGYTDTYIGRGRRDLSERGYRASGAKLVPEGTVLFTSRAPIGYCAIASNPICTNQGFKSWACESGVVPEYVRYYLLASVEYVDSLASGTTFREVSGKRVAGIAFPLPPTSEQRRIVAKLDALTARLARARAELARVELLAPRIRTGALAACFSSESVAAWPSRTISEVIAEGLIGLVRSKSEQGPAGVPYVRMNHFDLEGRWNERALTFVQAAVDEQRRFELRAGDVLFNTRNSIELVGKVAMWPEGRPGFVYNNNLLRLRLTPSVHAPFACFYMMSPYFRALMAQVKSATTSVAAIYQRSLYAAPIPVPPLLEQQQLSAKLNTAFLRADRLESEAARARSLLDRLESAILAKAFRGELVPQDPEDEPASVLLERIRAARAAAPKAKQDRAARGAVNRPGRQQAPQER